MQIGIQLYTVRQECEADFEGTLRALAHMGYEGVEFAWNYGGKCPQKLNEYLKQIGISVCGLHASLTDLLKPESETYIYAKQIGSPYVTTSLASEVGRNWFETIEKITQAAEISKEHGLQFTYHNHAQEFSRLDGKYALNLLWEQTNCDLVKCEFDTYWIQFAGEDPVSYIKKYPSRVPQIHLKDMDPLTGKFVEVGAGCIDLESLLTVANNIGTKWLIVEQDECDGSAIESAAFSISNLAKALNK